MVRIYIFIGELSALNRNQLKQLPVYILLNQTDNHTFTFKTLLMKHDINSLIGYKIHATDGELGTVKDFYFDDKAWTIRYLIVETGSWFSSKKVLVAPQAVSGVTSDTINVNLTMDQVKNSPDIDTNLPVNRQQEEVLHLHHAWQNYWDGNFFGGGTTGGSTIQANEVSSDFDKIDNKYDINLRSAMEVSGYRIHATDGEIGHVNNFILDTDAWTITTLVVDVKNNLIGGKKVLIDNSHIQAVQWYNAEVFLDMKTAAIESSPEYQA